MMLLFQERVALMRPSDAARHLRRAATALRGLTDAQWTKGFYAKDAQRGMVGVNDPTASSWCVEGLVSREYGHPAADLLGVAYAKAGGGDNQSLPNVNDSETSREALIERLERAASQQEGLEG